MISETSLRLLEQKMSPKCWMPSKRLNKVVDIDAGKKMNIDNISVLEIKKDDSTSYKISMPGLSQDNYKYRVLIRGKQLEDHVIKQYEEKSVSVNISSIRDYLSETEVAQYLNLLSSNNIRGCVDYLRTVEDRLNNDVTKKINASLVKKRKKNTKALIEQ